MFELKKKILIIDDDQLIREVLSMIVKQDGFEVDTAEDGEVGLEKVRTFHPDLVLVDLMMPKLSGFEVIHQMQSPDLNKIPIIVITGYSDAANEQIIREEPNVNDLLKKPVRGEVLLPRLHQLLDIPGTGTAAEVRKRVLVIDDDESVRDLIVQCLRSAGYLVQAADNGRTGLEKFNSFSPDLVLVDIMMPQLSGFEVIHRLQTPATMKIPIIVVTAYSDDANEQIIRREANVVELIRKPFGNQPLLDLVKKTLNKAR